MKNVSNHIKYLYVLLVTLAYGNQWAYAQESNVIDEVIWIVGDDGNRYKYSKGRLYVLAKN